MSHKDKQKQNNFFKAMCTDNSQREDLEIFGKDKSVENDYKYDAMKENSIEEIPGFEGTLERLNKLTIINK